MMLRTEKISLRTTEEDIRMFEQVADQCGKKVSTWMHDSLRELAIKEIYGTGESEEFTLTQSEHAMFRAVLMILQIAYEDKTMEQKEAYAKKAEQRITTLSSGENPIAKVT